MKNYSELRNLIKSNVNTQIDGYVCLGKGGDHLYNLLDDVSGAEIYKFQHYGNQGIVSGWAGGCESDFYYFTNEFWAKCVEENQSNPISKKETLLKELESWGQDHSLDENLMRTLKAVVELNFSK